MRHVIADIVDPPQRTNPGLKPPEKIWQAQYWLRCTILVAREIQGTGKSYADATKFVAEQEKISRTSLRKNVTKKLRGGDKKYYLVHRKCSP